MDNILSKNKNNISPTVEYYFYHPLELLSLYKLKTNMVNGESSYDGNLLLKIDVIENEALKLIYRDFNSLSSVEKKMVENIKKFYLDFYNKQLANDFKMVATYVSCKIFNQPHRSKIFNQNMRVNMVSYNNQLIKYINDVYDNFCSGKRVDETALNIMFEYFSGKITVDMNKNYVGRCDYLVKCLLNRNDYPISGKNFLLQYFSYKKCMKEKKPLAKVYVSSKKYAGGMLKSGTLGVSYGFIGVIFINEAFAKLKSTDKKYYGIDNDFNLIATLFHELQHFSQSLDAENGKVSVSAMKMIKSNIFRKYLSSSQFDEYTKNYDYRESEVEADYQGYKDAFMYLNGFVPRRLKELSKTRQRSVNMRNKSTFSVQFYENGLKTYIENYNVNVLRNIIYKNPRLLNEFPQLRLFFNPDGSYKGFEKLVSEYTDAQLRGESEEYLLTYNEFFLIEFHNRLYNGHMDLSRVRNDDDLFTIFSIISRLFNIETVKLSRMIDGVNLKNLDLFNKIASFRVQRICEYYNFITNNMNIVHGLIERERNLKIKNPRRANRVLYNLEPDYLNEKINDLRRLYCSNNLVCGSASMNELNNLQLRSVRR